MNEDTYLIATLIIFTIMCVCAALMVILTQESLNNITNSEDTNTSTTIQSCTVTKNCSDYIIRSKVVAYHPYTHSPIYSPKTYCRATKHCGNTSTDIGYMRD